MQEKKAPFRVAIAHGLVPGMLYTGPEPAEGGSVIDEELFRRHQVDYAAMGHIHLSREKKCDPCLICYPGSARIWRRGESGRRKVLHVSFNGRLQKDEIFLQEAGEYRNIPVPLTFEGKPADQLQSRAGDWGKKDWVNFEFMGIVEDEKAVAALEAELSGAYSPAVRMVTITRDAVKVLDGIGSQPVAKKFLELWSARQPEPERLCHSGPCSCPEPGARQELGEKSQIKALRRGP